MNELALFAGAGGGLLGSKLLGWQTVCYVENEPYCVKVIQARIRDGFLDDAPIWDDIKTFDGKPWTGCVDIITAGFPCQPFSVAGKRKGEMDERNLWPDTIRVIREVRPQFCLLENVPGLIHSGYFEIILKDLSEGGYDARWKIISAAEVGAPHKRDRFWIVCANTDSTRNGKQYDNEETRDHSKRTVSDVSHSTEQSFLLGQCSWKENLGSSRDGITQQMANTIQPRLEKRQSKSGNNEEEQSPVERGGNEVADSNNADATRQRTNGREISTIPESERFDICDSSRWWSVEPDVGRVANGVASRVDRLRTIGNGQVPAVVRCAWELLK